MNKHAFVSELDRRWRTIGAGRDHTDLHSRKTSTGCGHAPDSSTRSRATVPHALWKLMREEPYVAVLSAVTGNQAVQKSGPASRRSTSAAGSRGRRQRRHDDVSDQSLYPSDSVPNLLVRIHNALRRADEIHHMNGDHAIDWYVPLVADAEAGFVASSTPTS